MEVRLCKISSFFMLMFTIVFQISVADTVVFKNGDSISGKLIALENQTVVIKSKTFGTIESASEQIRSIITDAPVMVIFANQDQLIGKFYTEAGVQQFESNRFGKLQAFSIQSIQSIRLGAVVDASAKSVATNTQNSISGEAQNKPTTDEVYLHSGDRLFGTIVSLNENQLLMDTEFAKGLAIDREKISSITTIDSVTMISTDNHYMTGIINSVGDNQLVVVNNRSSKPHKYKLAEIKSIVRGDPQQVVRDEQKVKLTGRANVGLSRSSGNSENESYVGMAELRARTPINRFSLRGEKIFEQSNGDKTEDETFGSIKYDHFLAEKWFAFTSASFEEDEIELLNLRTALAAGVGYQFFERDDLFLSAELGPAYVNEDFDEEDSDSVSMRWGIDYEHDLFSWASIFHNQDGLYGIENSEDIIVRTRSGVRFPLGNNFNATAQANFDWDKSPPEGSDSTDKEYIFTLGYEF
jgi:putative salt-induced outer membrane protein YdiY